LYSDQESAKVQDIREKFISVENELDKMRDADVQLKIKVQYLIAQVGVNK